MKHNINIDEREDMAGKHMHHSEIGRKSISKLLQLQANIWRSAMWYLNLQAKRSRTDLNHCKESVLKFKQNMIAL